MTPSAMPDPSDPSDPGDTPHDVLAAEEFELGAGDPGLGHDAHDVLAAEEFALPGADPVLHHHGPVELPADPTGIAEPHDVLAAEEFALPVPPAHPHHEAPPSRRARWAPWLAAAAAVGFAALRWRNRDR